MRIITKQETETTWVPRIGEEATAELWRCRRIMPLTSPAGALLAGAGGIALSGDTLDKLLGVVLLAGAVGALATFLRCQRRLGEAISAWFGVKITGPGLPRMYPKRFDGWCQERGLHPTPKLRQDERMLWSRPATVIRRGGLLSDGRGHIDGMLRVTSERMMFVPARFGGIVTARPKVEQFPIGDFQSIEVSNDASTPGADGSRQTVSITFRSDGVLNVEVDRASEVLDELRALLPAVE
jgi:hypothetical protein